MTVAKGRSNCMAERHLVIQGFNDLLEIIAEDQQRQEMTVKANLYDIMSDCKLEEREKESLRRPWDNELMDIEERNIRIRHSIFIGLYSFWEISLKEIAEPLMSKNDKSLDAELNDKKSSGKKKSGSGSMADKYLSYIYNDNRPEMVQLIDGPIRKLRNYMVHGAKGDKRDKEAEATQISLLIESHPEFGIENQFGHYFFCNYKGLAEMKDVFVRELDAVENHVRLGKIREK